MLKDLSYTGKMIHAFLAWCTLEFVLFPSARHNWIQSKGVSCTGILESLSTDVFEPRTSTGSFCSSFSTFSCLTNKLPSSHFSIYDLLFWTKSELYRSKRRSFDFRLTSVAQKRLCLSSLITHAFLAPSRLWVYTRLSVHQRATNSSTRRQLHSVHSLAALMLRVYTSTRHGVRQLTSVTLEIPAFLAYQQHNACVHCKKLCA